MSDETYERGMEIRREVLGDEHVDRAVEQTTDLTRDFQDFITRYAWGEIWARPGLDRRTRSCMTLSALVALGRFDELGMHIRAAQRNGLTLDEIRALADGVGDAYLKVFVKVDRPFPGLAEQVRELLPNAVDIVVERPAEDKEQPATQGLERMTPTQLFTEYYRRQHQDSAPSAELMALFNRLQEDAIGAADPA